MREPAKTSPVPAPPAGPAALSLPALLGRFLKIGAIGFGGGMANIGLIEHELVRKEHAIDADEFLHGVGMAQLLGPFATNTALFVGNRLYGTLGGLSCAAAFMAPSVALVILLSWLYFSFHAIPALQGAIGGLGPVVIALIVSAAWAMGRSAVRTWPAAGLALLALGLSLLKLNPVYILAAAGVVGLVAGRGRLAGGAAGRPENDTQPRTQEPPPPPAALVASAVPGAAAAAGGVSLATLASTFVKVGVIFFGGGFVLVPILHRHLVESLGWLTPREFLDGVAISNLTPGPIAVLATFAGFRMHGIAGALVATVALFTPALALMTVLSHGYTRFRDSQRVRDALAGIAPAVVGLVAGAVVPLAPGALHGAAGVVLAAAALVLLIRQRWHPAFVLVIGAATGVVGWV